MPAIGEAGGVARSHAYDTSGEPSASEAGDAYVLAFGEASDQSQRLGIQHDRVLNDTGNMKDIRVSVEPPSRSPSDASASSGRAEISQSFLDYHYKVPTSPRPWST